MNRLVVMLALGCAMGCVPESTAPPPLQAASAEQATDVVRLLLDAAKAGDAARVAAQMCGAREAAQERATAALAGPLRIQGYDVARVEPAWVGAEPYFRVDVTLHKPSEADARSLSVRAREGCVDRLLGEPVGGAKRPDVNEIAL
jgi:hypothetical protein